jgi:hypothetical protein
MKLYNWTFFENLTKKFNFHQNLTTITGTLRDESYTFITSRSVLLRMINVSVKICRENQNTHFVISNFVSKIVPFGDNVEKYCTATEVINDNTAHAHCILDT